jgi:hypothetical protein
LKNLKEIPSGFDPKERKFFEKFKRCSGKNFETKKI